MMEITYAERVPDCVAYLELFETTGWNEMYRASAGDLQRSLTRSWHAISAFEGKRLIGFGRLLSDGVLYAVVFDVIVTPDRQRQGIGAGIMQRLLRRCEDHGIRDVLLFSARGTPAFYRKLGFVERPGEAPGMILRRAGEAPHGEAPHAG
jgi:GNAT superfamily N-acetyltransferase